MTTPSTVSPYEAARGLTRTETIIYVLGCIFTFLALYMFTLAVKYAVYSALCAHDERTAQPPKMGVPS